MPDPSNAEATMIANLETKTGKSLREWIELVRAAKLAKHGEAVEFLKTKHGLGHGYANLVVHHANASAAGASDATDLVDAQYAGAKLALRPIYDALVQAVTALGADVELAPKKAYVSLRRSKQFGLIQPSTADRIDVGLVLKESPAGGRLEPAGSFNAMVTHRVRVKSLAEVDAELKAWLAEAYRRG